MNCRCMKPGDIRINVRMKRDMVAKLLAFLVNAGCSWGEASEILGLKFCQVWTLINEGFDASEGPLCDLYQVFSTRVMAVLTENTLLQAPRRCL